MWWLGRLSKIKIITPATFPRHIGRVIIYVLPFALRSPIENFNIQFSSDDRDSPTIILPKGSGEEGTVACKIKQKQPWHSLELAKKQQSTILRTPLPFIPLTIYNKYIKTSIALVSTSCVPHGCCLSTVYNQHIKTSRALVSTSCVSHGCCLSTVYNQHIKTSIALVSTSCVPHGCCLSTVYNQHIKTSIALVYIK